MVYPTTRGAADPFDDIDREASGADAAMARQDRADLPGERSDEPGNRRGTTGDVYIDATREVSEPALDPDQAALDDDRELERIADGDPDVVLDSDADAVLDGDADAVLDGVTVEPLPAGLGVDDDDPIDETERAGDDARR